MLLFADPLGAFTSILGAGAPALGKFLGEGEGCFPTFLTLKEGEGALDSAFIKPFPLEAGGACRIEVAVYD